MEKSRCVSRICEEKREAAGAGDGKPGSVEDKSDSKSCVATGTHRSKPVGHVVFVSQPRVSQSESSENHLSTPVPLK